MAVNRLLLALDGQPRGESNSYAGMIMMTLVFIVFYFVIIQPLKPTPNKLEHLGARLKSGDRVILSGGIFGTIVGVDDDAFQVRIDDKTRIKVLKSSVSALQEPATEKTEK